MSESVMARTDLSPVRQGDGEQKLRWDAGPRIQEKSFVSLWGDRCSRELREDLMNRVERPTRW